MGFWKKWAETASYHWGFVFLTMMFYIRQRNSRQRRWWFFWRKTIRRCCIWLLKSVIISVHVTQLPIVLVSLVRITPFLFLPSFFSGWWWLNSVWSFFIQDFWQFYLWPCNSKYLRKTGLKPGKIFELDFFIRRINLLGYHPKHLGAMTFISI